MEMLYPIPQCTECLLSLARNAAKLAAGENPEFVEKMESTAKDFLTQAQNRKWTSPQIANKILRWIRDATGTFDPYREFKIREMDQAKRIYDHMKAQLPQDLRRRIRTAVVGNSFDFFKDPEALCDDIPRFLADAAPFAYDHVDRLETFLESGKRKILYFTDNAGEVYFDLPLLDYLAKKDGRPILVVKGGPAFNDLTRSDLERAGLMDRFDQVEDTGTDGAGIDWERVSDRFMGLIKESDLILSKGMANFETVFPKDLLCPTLFLFRVKCEPIHRYIAAPVNSSVALWKDAGIT